MAKKAKNSLKPPNGGSLKKAQKSYTLGYANIESNLRQLPDLSNLKLNQILIPALYVVSTPIGNLMDITLRSLGILNNADLIIAEDTRITQKLLSHYQIRKSIISYNDHNAPKIRPKIMNLLNNQKIIALVSDAGTPLISDPGYKLVKECINNNISVIAIPGATAFVAALVSSGIASAPITFVGFLPNKKKIRIKLFDQFAKIKSTFIFYETSRNLISTLTEIKSIFGNREFVVARELTKIHEEIYRGYISDYIEDYKDLMPPKGEITIVLSGHNNNEEVDYNTLDEYIKKALKEYSLKEAVNIIKNKTDFSKTLIYNRALELNKR